MELRRMRETATSVEIQPALAQHGDAILPGAWSRRFRGFAKRVFDLAASAVALVVLSPWLLLIALVIRMDSPGPAIFKQTRIGKNRRPFTFYKFRSMVSDNDPDVHKQHVQKLIRNRGGEGMRGEDGTFKLERDPRVTRAGTFLRKTSLDELPQLFNVVEGDMSLVGPRPPLPYEVELYEPRDMRRLEVLPGITGPWQVGGRTEVSFDEMVHLEVDYIDNWSLWADAKILWKTLFVVLSQKGAS